jgi:two-component system, OmpR family, alkaline phosphatase synthesis response regulator PhoP
MKQTTNIVWIVGEADSEVNLLLSELRNSGIQFLNFSTFAKAFDALENSALPEVIVLITSGEFLGAFEFCQMIKSDPSLKEISVFFISDTIDERHEISALSSGANAFFIRPLRTKAISKHISTKMNNELNILLNKKSISKKLEIDRYSFSVFLNNRPVPLSRKEFELLHLIASNPRKLFTREEIYKKIWKKEPTEKDRTIDVHILRLRKKLGEEFITTQKGVGYRFENY